MLENILYHQYQTNVNNLLNNWQNKTCRHTTYLLYQIVSTWLQVWTTTGVRGIRYDDTLSASQNLTRVSGNCHKPMKWSHPWKASRGPSRCKHRGGVNEIGGNSKFKYRKRPGLPSLMTNSLFSLWPGNVVINTNAAPLSEILANSDCTSLKYKCCIVMRLMIKS